MPCTPLKKGELHKAVYDYISDSFNNTTNLQLISVTGSGKTFSSMKEMHSILVDDEDYRTISLALPYKSLLTEKYIKFTEELLKNNPEKVKYVALNRMFSFHKPLANIKFTTYDTLYSEVTLNTDKRPLLFASNDDTIISDEIHTFLQSDPTLFINFTRLLNYSACHKIIMTATLPTGVQEFINEKIINNKKHNETGETVKICTQRERITEVSKEIVNDPTTYPQLSINIVEENKSDKILFIFNTISRATTVYEELARTLFPETNQDYLIYKFLEENNTNIETIAFDKQLQSKLITYLQQKCEIVILTSLQPQFIRNILEKLLSTDNNLKVIVSTQVVEIGFDDKNISLVVTEPAPVSALIQRWGRIRNRGRVVLLLPLKPDRKTQLPYSPEEYLPPYNYLLKTSEDNLNTIINNLLDYIENSQKIIDTLSPKYYRTLNDFKKYYAEQLKNHKTTSFRNDKIVFILPDIIDDVNKYRKYKDLVIQTSLSQIIGRVKKYGIQVRKVVGVNEHKFFPIDNLYVARKLKDNHNLSVILVFISPQSYMNLTLKNPNPDII